MAEVEQLSRPPPLATTAPLFTAQPALRLPAPPTPTSRPLCGLSSGGRPEPQVMAMSVADPGLSSIDVERLLRDSIKAKSAAVLQAFKAYDSSARGNVTKGEFRRVLETTCFPLTSEQFESVLAKSDAHQDGTIRYEQFVEKFLGKRPRTSEEPTASSYKYVQPNWSTSPQQPAEINIDTVEKMLMEKIKKTPKDFIRSFHLYDYNRDGMIQKHDFRKAIDSNGFKLSDQQFDRFWMRHDYHHSGVMDYREYLRKVGIGTGRPSDVPNASQQHPSESNLGVFATTTRRSDVAPPKAPTFEDLDREFRAKMRSNALNLKKAFIACDRHRDGFIELEDLRAVLSAFTVPMSEQLFIRLMEKAEIKASGKVSWEYVWNKFQDAQSAGNGQTIPIKPGHKFFPLREADQPASADELWTLLYKHVNSAYGSFKTAFLEIDEKRTGKITKKDIKKVLSTFKIKLTNEQLSKLMKRLDPEDTNAIDYIAFLDLFEPRETREGHKWLKSQHRFNSRQAPVILAWETVEEILRDKITDNWKDVADKLGAYDPLGTAKINRNHLRKILTASCLPVSDDHFSSMMERLGDKDGEKVNYVEFLAKLGVDVKPGDLVGVSTEIFNAHNKEMQRRETDRELREVSVTNAMAERTNLMSPDEVITRLRDRMMQHKVSVRQAFLHYDKEKKGKISKKTFRKVLTDQGILTNDELFEKVVELLKFHRGQLDYQSFVETFDDPREPSSEIIDPARRSGNHRVNPIRGDEIGMTASEVETRLRSKLRENFEDLRGAFYKFDADHQGMLRRSDFRRMLDSFMLIVSDAEFDVLCQRLGFVNKRSRLSYKDFLDKFEVRDLPEGHKWLWSEHRFNDVKASPLMTAEEAHAIIARKAHRQWRDLAKAFIAIGGTAGGSISRQQLKELLARFIVPISDDEFKKLWRKYDPHGDGSISHEAFLKQLGAEFAPGDELGPSRRIFDGSYKHLDKHQTDMLIKQEEQTFNQALRTWAMPVSEIHQQLKDRIRDQYADFYKAFKKYDQNNTGYLTEDDIQRILVDFSYFVSDSQLDELLKRLGINSKDDRVPYEQFLNGFEEGRKDHYQPSAKEFKFKSYEQLSPEKAEAVLQRNVVEQSAALSAVLKALDKERSGRVRASDLRRVLDSFCFKMTDQQFKHVMNRFRVATDGDISYSSFLEVYNDDLVQDPSFIERHVRDLKEAIPIEISELSSAQLVTRLSQSVTENFYDLASRFAEVDYAGIGVVSKEDFRDILFKYCFRMQPEQYENLLSTLKITAHGNIDYHDFLKSYSTAPQSTVDTLAAGQRPATVDGGRQSAIFDRRPGTRDSLTYAERELLASRGSLSRATTRAGSRAGAVTPMINAEDIEAKHGAAVRRHWKDFLHQCRLLDATGSGQIEFRHFFELAEKFGFGMGASDLQRLATKYDVKNKGTFCYMHFLRHFVLAATTPRQSFDDADRQRAPTAASLPPSTPAAASGELLEALQRIGRSVAADWKEMRRAFKASEEGMPPGCVSANGFRKVLKQFSVNLSEDEFYHLLAYYDKGARGLVSYNSFLANLLKMVPPV